MVQQGQTAAARWAQGLAAWAIPATILAAAPISPWGHMVPRFAGRADSAVEAARAGRGGVSYQRALDGLRLALGGHGTVLDLGCGAGAASLPLLGEATGLTGVDPSEQMLTELAQRAVLLAPATPCRTVLGRWPAVLDDLEIPVIGMHDIVVSHHVVFDVAAIGEFLTAAVAQARHVVVIEIPPTHPLTWMNPLWQRFWGLERPTSPTWEDLVAVIAEANLGPVTVDQWEQTDLDPTSPGERVGLVARRLCLAADRVDEVADALVELGRSPGSPASSLRETVTITISVGAT